jgi:hypothetical protein
MQRSLITAACLGLLTTVAAAQPADPAAPVPPPPAEPPVPPAPPTPPPPPVVEDKKPEPVKTEDKEKKPEATKLAVGKEGQGRLQPGLLAQGWFLLDRTGGKTTVSTFRLRRMEIAAKGEILPKRVGFNMMFDPAKVRETVNTTVTDSGGDTVTVKAPAAALSVLQDFYITGFHKYVDASIGQFKIPVSWEGYNSSAKIMMPERAFISNTYGDKRDLGIRLTKTFKKWMYSAGVFNGQGLNSLDTNVQKDVALRLEVYPVEGLTIAGVTYDSIGIRNRAGTKDRWEADLRYEHGPYLFQSEYIRARDVVKDNAGAVTAQGFYALVGYTIKDKRLCGDLQPVLRVGYGDPDISKNLDPTMTAGSDELWHYDAGVNYYLKGHEMKLQGVFSRQQFDDKDAVNEVIVAAQVWY